MATKEEPIIWTKETSTGFMVAVPNEFSVQDQPQSTSYLVIPKAMKGALRAIGVRTIVDNTDPDVLVQHRGRVFVTDSEKSIEVLRGE